MMPPLNLNLQLNATIAVWGLEPDMQETSATEVCASAFSFFLREKESAPRTCCRRRRWAHRTCTYDDPSTTTHAICVQRNNVALKATAQ